MAWTQDEIKKISDFARVYRLPDGCWAHLTVNEVSVDAGHPEGLSYAWVLLMPGSPPTLRGSRMAGIDNAADIAVRKAIAGTPGGPTHFAHRHWPDWRATVEVDGVEWPTAGKGQQLTEPPASADELWALCLECLNDFFDDLEKKPPTESELFSSQFTHEDFAKHQQAIKQKGRPAP